MATKAGPLMVRHEFDGHAVLLPADAVVADRIVEPQVYVYRWDRQGRKGQRCVVTARGKMNSCRVEFEDGHKMITSRNALRKWRPGQDK